MFVNDVHDLSPGEAPDAAIVGGGAVGILLAVDLARAGQRVLLLEAGQPTPGASNYTFDEVENSGRRHIGIKRGRFRALGGTTTKWGGQLVPLDPIAFQERNWLGEDGWPIEAGDLTEAYERAYDLLGMSRRLSEAAAWRRLGVNPPPTGDDLELFLTRWAPEPNFARLFAADLKHNRNLVVVTSAVATGLFCHDGSTRLGLMVRTPRGSTRIDAARVVLANGTMEIARLLLMPLHDGGTAPWASNKWIGRGFLDHVDADAGAVIPLDTKRFHHLFDAAVLDGLKYLPKLKLSQETQRRDKMVGVAAHFVSSSRSEAQLTALKALARSTLNGTPLDLQGLELLRSGSLLSTTARTAARYLFHRRIYNPGDKGIQLRLTSEQIGLPQSGLTLTDCRDPMGMLKATLHWQVDGRELSTLARFSRQVANFLEHAGLAKVELDPLLVSEDPAFLEKVEDGYHHMGMARMADGPNDGVVDRDLKVFGTENLFVAGAATFRSPGFANPSLTAMALAVRLSKTFQHRPGHSRS